MNIPVEQYILYSEAELNVLPLSSFCHDGCIFCSHKNTAPDDLRSSGFYGYRRSFEDVSEHIGFLDPEKRVVIGESATKISEGEPFMWKGVEKIILAVRSHIGKNLISITTSGGFIGDDLFNIINAAAPLEINFSLNSFNAKTRDRIVLDGRSAKAFENLERLSGYGESLKLSVSLMAINEEITPLALIVEDIENLRKISNIALIKVFLPRFAEGLFSKFFKNYDEFTSYAERVSAVLSGINAFSRTPVVLEPLAPPDTKITVHAVTPDSRACLAGIRTGDEILSVNGRKPRSRSEAYRFITKTAGKLELTVNENKAAASNKSRNKTITFEDFDGKTEGAGGMIFISDISTYDLDRFIEINGELAAKGSEALALTTVISENYLRRVFLENNILNIKPAAVKSVNFKGNIDCTGLLTFKDIETAIGGTGLKNKESGTGGERQKITKTADGGLDIQKNEEAELSRNIIIPGIMFDHLGFDLNGERLEDFKEKFETNFIVI